MKNKTIETTASKRRALNLLLRVLSERGFDDEKIYPLSTTFADLNFSRGDLERVHCDLMERYGVDVVVDAGNSLKLITVRIEAELQANKEGL